MYHCNIKWCGKTTLISQKQWWGTFLNILIQEWDFRIRQDITSAPCTVKKTKTNKRTNKIPLCCCLDPWFVQNLDTLCSSGSLHPLFKKIGWFRRKFKVGHQGWPVFLEEPIPLHMERLHKLMLPHLERSHPGQHQLSINLQVARRLHSNQLQPAFQHKTWGLQ